MKDLLNGSADATIRAGAARRIQKLAGYRRIAWVIFALALVVRLAILVFPTRSFPTPAHSVNGFDMKNILGAEAPPGLFAEEGLNIARSLAYHNAFADPFLLPTGPTAHVPPAFPWVMAAVFRLFGDGTAGNFVRCLIICLEYSALIALLPMAASLLRLPRATGVLAGFAAAIYPFFLRIENALSRDDALTGIFLLLLACATYRLATSKEKPGLRAALLYGAAWGALLYVQAGAVTLIPVWLLIIIAWQRDQVRQRLVFSVAAIATICLVIAPWTIRNRVVLGEWMLMRDNAGFELSSSNRDRARASFDEEFDSKDLFRDHPLWNAALDRRIQREGEVRFNRESMIVGRAWIEAHPRRFAELTFWRIIYFWFDMPRALVKCAGRTLLTLLGLCGIVLLWRRRFYAQALIISSTWLIFPAPYYLVRSLSRYAAPMYGFFLLPAGFFVYELWRMAANQRAAGTAYTVSRTLNSSFQRLPSRATHQS